MTPFNSKNLRKIIFICAIVVAVAFLTNYFIPGDFYRHSVNENHTQPASSHFSLTATNSFSEGAVKSKSVVRNVSAESRAMQFLKMESKKIGQIDSDPAATESRLVEFARLMGAPELTRLKQVALQMDVPGDERFLSAYLLSKSGSAHAIIELMAIARAPVPENVSRDSRMYDQEVMIRAQAIEGLASVNDRNQARQLLREFLNREGNVSLAEHARRTLQDLERSRE